MEKSIIRGFFLSEKAILILVLLNTLPIFIGGDFAPDCFGTPGLALYSTFRMFTIEGWYEIPDMIAKNASEAMAVFARIYFALELFIGGILGMSLINSIFVDAAVHGGLLEVAVEGDAGGEAGSTILLELGLPGLTERGGVDDLLAELYRVSESLTVGGLQRRQGVGGVVALRISTDAERLGAPAGFTEAESVLVAVLVLSVEVALEGHEDGV